MNDAHTGASVMNVRKARVEEIASIEPLWSAIYRQHADLLPTLDGLPLRSIEDSWARRRSMYESWLADDTGFLVIAELDDRLVGYAAMHVTDGLTVWQTGDHIGLWETMSVLPAAMGKGVGTAITNAVLAELQRRGVTELMGKMTEGNPDAQQFFMNKGGMPINRVIFFRLPALEASAVDGTDAPREV
jgi:GNAT superfamily N-acetyltransferase